MDSMAGIPRNASVEELALSMFGAGAAGFRLGRTPSEAEFSQFLSAGGLAPGGDGDMPGGGMHRVASIDLLRRMVMSQQAAISQAAAAGEAHGDAGHTPVATGLAGGALTAAPLVGPTAVPVVLPPVLPDWGKVLRGAATESVVPLVPGTLPVLAPPVGGPGKKAAKPAPAKKESARARAAREKREAVAAEKAARGEQSMDDDFGDGGETGQEDEEMDEEELRKAMAKGGFTAEEVRRQRRMLSNRESARRSRRRKLEHVHTLQAQINVLRSEAAALVERLRDAELRAEATLRENVMLKVELERMAVAMREASGAAGGGAAGGLLGKPVDRMAQGSLPRIASTEHIAKRLREGEEVGTDSPRGFVPFRSLRSYENLLALQAQAAAGAG